jgi:hypothetical protein
MGKIKQEKKTSWVSKSGCKDAHSSSDCFTEHVFRFNESWREIPIIKIANVGGWPGGIATTAEGAARFKSVIACFGGEFKNLIDSSVINSIQNSCA